MQLTDKERFEEIQLEYSENVKDGILPRISDSDYDWIFQRAKLVQKLEKENEILNFNLNTTLKNNHAHRLENSRYREALEYYADEQNYEADVCNQWGPIVPVLNDRGQKARTELEQSK